MMITYNEWMLDDLKYLLLILNVVHVLAVNDLLLLHCLDGKLGIRVIFQPGVFHISEGTYISYLY